MHHVKAIAADGKCKMLQRRRPVVSVDHVAWLLVQLRHPARELGRICQGRRQEHLRQRTRLLLHVVSVQNRDGAYWQDHIDEVTPAVKSCR